MERLRKGGKWDFNEFGVNTLEHHIFSDDWWDVGALQSVFMRMGLFLLQTSSCFIFWNIAASSFFPLLVLFYFFICLSLAVWLVFLHFKNSPVYSTWWLTFWNIDNVKNRPTCLPTSWTFGPWAFSFTLHSFLKVIWMVQCGIWYYYKSIRVCLINLLLFNLCMSLFFRLP